MLQKFQKTFWEKNLWDRSASCFDIFYTCTSATARLFHLKDQDKCWRSDVTAGTRRINKRWLGFTDATLKCGLYLVTNTDNWSTLEGRAHVLVHCNVNAYSVLANQLNSNKRCFKKKEMVFGLVHVHLSPEPAWDSCGTHVYSECRHDCESAACANCCDCVVIALLKPLSLKIPPYNKNKKKPYDKWPNYKTLDDHTGVYWRAGCV